MAFIANAEPQNSQLAGLVVAEPLDLPANGRDWQTLSTAPSANASTMATELSAADFPPPLALTRLQAFDWNEDRPAVENYAAIGARLADCGDLFRSSVHTGGLVFTPALSRIVPAPILKGVDLAPKIADRLRVRVVKNGQVRGWRIPTSHLDIMLRCEAFLQRFRPLDMVSHTPIYLPDYRLTSPGYNDGGLDNRVYFCGEAASVELHHDTINEFLEAMSFATPADRANTVAAALTVMLRNHFPGTKPAISVTANKSHAGKGTIISFAAGANRVTTVSYEETDWALQRSFTGAVNHNPDTAVINIDNARLGHRSQFIRSAFLERFLTDPEPTLFSTGTGAPRRFRNDIVVAITTNFGSLSEDLANRALPIHLELVGDIANRHSAIGNPKLEFLPANQSRIEAELHGMIELWKRAGSPIDTTVHHPFTHWATTIGGILRTNGFEDFLINYSMRRTADDPLARALGLLGAARPDEWCRSAEWTQLTVDLGLVIPLIPAADRENKKGLERGMGVVLSAHRDEEFVVETDDERVAVRLEKARRRFDSESPSTRYRFVVVQRTPIPVDAADM